VARAGKGGTPATSLLAGAGVPFTLHPYAHDPAVEGYGEEAAEALGVNPHRIFKTLVADAGELVVAVVPVAARLDLKALAAVVSAKRAALARPEAARRATGYVVGGISPLGSRVRLRTVLDASAGAYGTIFVSAGRRGLQLELAPADLVRLTGAAVAPIAT